MKKRKPTVVDHKNQDRKPITFTAVGPFPLKRERGKNGIRLVDDPAQSFWSLKDTPIHAQKTGCYIFTIGTKPYYVGKATKSFSQEVFNSKNLDTYRRVISKRTGRPMMYFVTYRRPTGRAGAPPTKVISQVEKLLIGLAHSANPDLENSHHLNKEDRFCITGVYNAGQGKPSRYAQRLRKVLQLVQK